MRALGARLRAAARALARRRAARARPARRGARAGGLGAERVRPRGLRPPAGRPRRARWRSGAAGSWRSRAAGTSRASRAASPTPTSSSTPFAPAGRCCSTSGRYTEVKRIPLLIRAHARARERFEQPAPLVLLGGFPGEWEGEHPLDGRARDRRPGRVPRRLARPRRPARRAQRGRPAGAAVGARAVRRRCSWRRWRAGCRRWRWTPTGPAEIVDDGETGWLVPPDDEEALAEALVEAVNDDDERRRRGERGLRGGARRATRGRRWRAAWRTSTTRSRDGRPPSAGDAYPDAPP